MTERKSFTKCIVAFLVFMCIIAAFMPMFVQHSSADEVLPSNLSTAAAQPIADGIYRVGFDLTYMGEWRSMNLDYRPSLSDPLVQYYRDPNAISQLWKFQYSGGYYEIIPFSDQSLRVTDQSPQSTIVTVKPSTGQDNQKWILVPMPSRGYCIAPKLQPTKAIFGTAPPNGVPIFINQTQSIYNAWKITPF
jgi:hypothetical protein